MLERLVFVRRDIILPVSIRFLNSFCIMMQSYGTEDCLICVYFFSILTSEE